MTDHQDYSLVHAKTGLPPVDVGGVGDASWMYKWKAESIYVLVVDGFSDFERKQDTWVTASLVFHV